MKRWMQLGVGLALLVLLLPGCSGNSGGSGSTGGGAAGATGNTSSDADITKAVQQKIAADPVLKAANIQVKVTGGQVELDGSVKSIEEKNKAEDAVNEAIKGFSKVNAGVIDNLTIAEGGSAGGSQAGAGNGSASSGASGKQ